MLRPYVSRCVRAACSFVVFTPVLVAVAHAQKLGYSTDHRDHTRVVAQNLTGPAKLTARPQGQRAGISLAVGFFHGGGTKDLLTGYATSNGGALLLQSGAPEALATIPRCPSERLPHRFVSSPGPLSFPSARNC